jgi:hypothetical protein
MKLVKIFKEMLKEAEYTQGTLGFEYDEDSVISNIEDLNKFLSGNSGKEFEGSIDFQYNQSITSLPKGLKVKGNVNLMGCDNLISLPSDLEVGGNLNLKSTPLAEQHSGEELKQMFPKAKYIISK